MAQREMVLGCDIEKDLRDLDPHLTASEKPSALVCLKLKHLSSGAPIGPCMYALHGLDIERLMCEQLGAMRTETGDLRRAVAALREDR